MVKSFSNRMWAAVAFIESGREHTRQLDPAFENGDGNAMTAALYTLSKKRPLLAANLPRYVLSPTLFGGADKMVGNPMSVIRKFAKAERDRFLAAFNK